MSNSFSKTRKKPTPPPPPPPRASNGNVCVGFLPVAVFSAQTIRTESLSKVLYEIGLTARSADSDVFSLLFCSSHE